MRILRENRRILLIFLVFSLLFAAWMMLMEGLGFVDTYYFLVTTATTVGYGDYAPKTPFGKVLVTGYMVVGIALIGLFLGKVTDIMVNVSSRRKKGLLAVKSKVDLIITGYPGDEKVRNIVAELRNDSRFEAAVIVCVNNRIDEKPAWMSALNVEFIRGVASDGAILAAAGIGSAQTALILANDAGSVESDDHSTSVCAVIERINPGVRTIIEKVRKDEMIFEIANADTIVDIAAPSVLAQEVLDPGAIELQNAIFSTHTRGTQFNLAYTGADRPWSGIAVAILNMNAIPEGFQNPGEKHFNLLPSRDEIVQHKALIKYRGTRLLTRIE